MSGAMRYGRPGPGRADEPRERSVTLKCGHPTTAPPVVTFPGTSRKRDLYLCPECRTHKTRSR